MLGVALAASLVKACAARCGDAWACRSQRSAAQQPPDGDRVRKSYDEHCAAHVQAHWVPCPTPHALAPV